MSSRTLGPKGVDCEIPTSVGEERTNCSRRVVETYL